MTAATKVVGAEDKVVMEVGAMVVAGEEVVVPPLLPPSRLALLPLSL